MRKIMHKESVSGETMSIIRIFTYVLFYIDDLLFLCQYSHLKLVKYFFFFYKQTGISKILRL